MTYERFRLTSRALHLTFGKDEAVMRGDAKLSPCPCPDPPVSLRIAGARATRSGDLVLRWPRIYLGPVPVFALPWLWLRPPDRPGLLPPTITLRGADGLLLGAGARLPWKGSDDRVRSLELRAAGYLQGGVELDARLDTPTSTGRLTWDRLRRDRFVLDAHGFVQTDSRGTLAWDVDAIRGARGLVATPSLAAAARPFDVGAAEASFLLDPGRGAGAIVGTGLTARARRGEGTIVWGPTIFAAIGGAAGAHADWEASGMFAMLAGGSELHATPYARGALAVEGAPWLGPVATRLRVGSRARIAGEGSVSAWDAVAEAGAEARLPFERAFAGRDAEAPLVHRVEPVIEARAAVSASRGALFRSLRPDFGPLLGLAAVGVSSTLGQAYGGTLAGDARIGLLATALGTSSLGWMSLEGALGVFSARAEVLASDGESAGIGAAAELRVGSARGPSAELSVAGGSSGGGALARSITGGGLFAGDALGIVAESGVTAGTGLTTPLSRSLGLRARADADARTRKLVGIQGSLMYLHIDGCVSLELGASYRAGRQGVTAFLAVDLIPPLPPR